MKRSFALNGRDRLRTLTLSALLFWATAPVSAGPGGFGAATEWTQLLNNAELASIAGLEARILSTGTEQLLTEVEQLATQLRTYEIMLRNVRSLPEQHLRAAMAPVLRLREIGAEARSIARAGQSLDTFLRYDDWQSRWQASLSAGLGAAGATLADVKSEAELIDLVSTRFGTEAGQMQVLQGANQIAASLARQMNGLRAITATQAEQTSIAWSRVLADMDREEALRRRHEREVHETLESLEAVPPGRSLNDIFRIGGKE